MPKNQAADAAPMAMNTTAGRLTAEPLSVESLNPLVMDCGVYLPGCRHRGRAMVVAELSLLRSHLPPVSHLAQLVTYYQTVPRKSAAKNGLILLIVGRPDQYSNAFALIEQLLCHFHVRQLDQIYSNEITLTMKYFSNLVFGFYYFGWFRIASKSALTTSLFGAKAVLPRKPL